MDRSNILLTGATGFVGQWVLRELLLRGHEVTALVRAGNGQTGEQRLRRIMQKSGWPGEWNAAVRVVEGSLPHGLPRAADVKLCDRLIHSGAALNFHRDQRGEPFRTNLEGTKQLGRLASDCGMSNFLHVSTAYVCGNARGMASEGVEQTAEVRNDYEASKREAEKWLVNESGLPCTIARPGIVVGDSQTGRTASYFGIYRVLRSISRLCERLPVGSDGTRHLPLRLAFTGEETSHLIPVDVVASAVVDLAVRDDAVGECVHLTPQRPLTTGTLLRAVADFHNVRGIEFVGPDGVDVENRNTFERVFDRETQIVGQYFEDDPTFETNSQRRLLPEFPVEPVDYSLLMKLQAFAAADDWGDAKRQARSKQAASSGEKFDCGDFFLRHFPAASAASRLEQINGLSTIVRFEITDATRGHWLCRLQDGLIVDIAATDSSTVQGNFHYQTDVETFQKIVSGGLNIREAFFARQIHIHGDIERALLLAVLFEELLQESPYQTPGSSTAPMTEAACA